MEVSVTALSSQHLLQSMPMFEVWEYGEGDGPRNMYEAVSEEKAIKAYMERPLVNGKTYRAHLQDQGAERLLICVKDPAKKGTRENPNYPSVYTIDFSQGTVETSFKGTLVDGELQDDDQSTMDEHVE